MEAKSTKLKGLKGFLRMSQRGNESNTKQNQSIYKPKSANVGRQSNVDSNTLEKKYGEPSKVLSGGGAGGTILLVTRQRDNATFAVKRFSQKHAMEDEGSYKRKIVTEFYIGSKLHHSNIIATLDLFGEYGQWYEVMEYAPYCLFDRVLSRMMSVDEINCSFLQIIAGVSYLHSAGFAHRDLKLENVVVTEMGIMKIIDFGSAVICRDPGTRSATGVVGSLPYMAPEILHGQYYDPEKADIWSLAIIYCSMILGRFPWKTPDCTNEAFRLFTTLEHQHIGKEQQSMESPPVRASKSTSKNSVTLINVALNADGDTKTIVEKALGPWGLLRQLPSDSRDVIGKMLGVNPHTRLRLDHIIKSPWASQSKICSQDAGGMLHHVDGHEHGFRNA